MDNMWEFLSNNSPKLICKPRSKTPLLLHNNGSAKNLKIVSNQTNKIKPISKTPLKLSIENSQNHATINSVSNRSVLTSRVANNKPFVRIHSKKNVSPISSSKKFAPVLSNIQSLKIVKIIKK